MRSSSNYRRADFPIFLVTRLLDTGVLESAADGVAKTKPPGALGDGKASIGPPPSRSSVAGRGVGGTGTGVAEGLMVVPIILWRMWSISLEEGFCSSVITELRKTACSNKASSCNRLISWRRLCMTRM